MREGVKLSENTYRELLKTFRETQEHTEDVIYAEEVSRGSYTGRVWETLSENGREALRDLFREIKEKGHGCTEMEVAYLFAGVSAARGYTPEMMAKKFEEDPAEIYGDIREKVEELLRNRIVLENTTIYHTGDLCIVALRSGAWFVPLKEVGEDKYLGIDLSTTGRNVLMKVGDGVIRSEVVRGMHNYREADPAVHKKFTEKVRDLIYGRHGRDELDAGAPPERRMTKETPKGNKEGTTDPLLKAIERGEYGAIRDILKGDYTQPVDFEELFEE